ncbi:MAG: MFS transporter [Cycloclasticus sp.]|nr:MFS transporter [Cycloclasticus sp.]
MSRERLPYWRLSTVYFCYFAALGALMPYLSLYLQSLGFLAAQVGIIFAIMQGTRLISPNILASFSRYFSNRMRQVQLSCLISLIAFSVFLVRQDFLSIALTTFAFSFFLNAALPQFEAVTLRKITGDTSTYSEIRLWGSVGFIITVAGIGFLLSGVNLTLWPWLVSLCLLALLMSTLTLTDSSANDTKSPGLGVLRISQQKPVIAFLVVVFLMQASHGPYYAFYSILLASLDYTENQIGQLWSLGVLAEIALFILFKRVFTHVSLRFVLLLSILLTVLRWLVLAYLSNHLYFIMLAQLLHAASFGAFHVVCIELTHQHFKGRNLEQGQALYSSIGFGAGGMCGGLAAGVMWDKLGEVWVFGGAALLSFIAFWIAWVWIERGQSDELHPNGDGVSSI